MRKAVNKLARWRVLELDAIRGSDESVSSGDSSGVCVRSTDLEPDAAAVTTQGDAGMVLVGVVALRSEGASLFRGCNFVNRAAACVNFCVVVSSAASLSCGFSSDFFLTSPAAPSAVDARCRMLTDPERGLPVSDRVRLVWPGVVGVEREELASVCNVGDNERPRELLLSESCV